MVTLGLLTLGAVGVLAWVWMTRSKAPAKKRPMRGVPGTASEPALRPDVQLAQFRRDDSVWGVMLRIPPGQGCASARNLKDKRFALERAPRVPVQGCDAPACACGYLPLRERRRRDVVPPEGEERRGVGRVKWDQDL